ncbi:AfsR/SARP family transcriptional regulator [Micromonospora narathiwatensis]|uniref:DNA-binding transcriptional activator of the SARP family n=1 Tax=Micromonospora narathiwatensis TaxID=299146 RepID=A0A1A8ZTS1_9ACTN|nr:BTAD domain-containing putative transcriptional regulator [Micromonospora narathiwatensis]SBT47225.1 DNA-binding transcriptional activator of the SARP family [Micromonospora narathiwatensis]
MKLGIRLLGSVELYVDGELVPLGAAKRRAVLAGLALDANRPVSLSRLAEMVWADAPPASAVANLRTHAAALRRALGERLIARPHAYELRVAPDELDVTEFQRLAGEGRALLATEDFASAIAALTAALAHWRGASGDGLPQGTALDNRWASLDEQRLQVFEELAEARLSVGEHGPMLAELRTHLAAHPLRERAWAQLMLALYRCGDALAALNVYQDARTILDQQLGIEPGGELAGLHRAVLDRAPELSYAPPATPTVTVPAPAVEVRPTVGWTVPRELPADLVPFVGRTRETADVVAGLTNSAPPAVAVSGMAGIGKTALAVRAAHVVAADFPDGQVFVDLGYQPSLSGDDVVARILRAVGVDADEIPERTGERAGRLRSLLAGCRVLLIVDGVTNAAQVRPLVPAVPGPALIVVGQRCLRGLDGVCRVTLGGLPATEGHTLLDALGGAERLAAAPADAAALVRLCAGSPLALRIAASRLARRPTASVADLVAQLRDDLLDWLTDDDLSVRDRLDLGYAALCADDELIGQVFVLLGSAPEEATAPHTTAARLGVSVERVRQALEKLLDAHLVCVDESGGYRLPPLVCDYAAELAEPPAPSMLHPLPAWPAGPVPMTPVRVQRPARSA